MRHIIQVNLDRTQRHLTMIWARTRMQMRALFQTLKEIKLYNAYCNQSAVFCCINETAFETTNPRAFNRLQPNYPIYRCSIFDVRKNQERCLPREASYAYAWPSEKLALNLQKPQVTILAPRKCRIYEMRLQKVVAALKPAHKITRKDNFRETYAFWRWTW